MKKTIFVLVLLLTLPIIFAASIEMDTEFDQGETLIAKVSANFVTPISEDNIAFYRGHVKIPMVYDFGKLDNTYYIYAQLLGKTENNYSLKIEDATYFTGATTSDEDIVKDFIITNKTADFSVNPGFVSTEIDFSLEIQNLQESDITVDISDKDPVTLSSGEIKNINFNLNELTNETELITIELSSSNMIYSVPAYLTISDSTSPDDELEGEEIINGEGDELEGEEIIDGNEIIDSPEIIVDDGTESIEDYEDEDSFLACADLGGNICKKDYDCDIDEVDALDAKCCLGNCIEEETSSMGKILGWSLIVIIIIVLFYLFKKMRRPGRRKIGFLRRR
ncbi:hypothetical protein ACFLZJ_00930 [Nanoarchaeota archaeon]